MSKKQRKVVVEAEEKEPDSSSGEAWSHQGAVTQKCRVIFSYMAPNTPTPQGAVTQNDRYLKYGSPN